MPTVTIDGHKVRIKKGLTVLDAAKKAGIWIPTLCHHAAVSSEASCRLCMVELDRGGWTQLITACNYPVRRDIVVYTSSEKARKARRGVMELLLARAPESPELAALAARMGVEGTGFPTVTASQRNCILCGLCVRLCDEVIGQSAIGFAGRGAERSVTTPFREASDDCIACGACALICPVGTITMRLHEGQRDVEVSPFKSRAKLIVCEKCGLPIYSAPVSRKAISTVKLERKAFTECLRLCPKCRRSATVDRLTSVPIRKE